MSCTIQYKGKEYSDKEFKKLLSDGEFQSLVKSGAVSLPGLDFYQTGKTQQEIVDKLVRLNELVQPNDGETYLVDGRPVRRVTAVIKSRQKKKFGTAVDKATKDIWEEARATGEKLHLFNQDIVNRLTNKPGLVDRNTLTTNEKIVYDNLASYIQDLIGLKIQGGSIFLAETRIADVNKNLAGTVDLLEIMPDGNINIYDYKTRSKESLNKIKLDEYSQQLKSYSDILESVTGANVLQRRIVPIKVSRDTDGNIKIDIKTQEPVAMEKTGIEELDELLDKLQSRLDYITNQVVVSSQKLSHNAKVENLQKSIKSIQMNRDLATSIGLALEEVETIVNDLKNGSFDLNTNLREAHDILKLYKEYDRFVPESFVDEETTRVLGILISQARLAERILLKAEEKYLVENGEKYGIIGTEGTKTKKDFLSPVKELGRWDRWANGASYSEHPIVQTLRRAVENQIVKTREDFITIRDNVKDKQQKMFDFLNETTFQPLLQESENGLTGRLVDKVSNKYWVDATKAKAAGDVKWFESNSNFNSERYKRDLESYKKFITNNTKLKQEQKNNLVNKWVKDNQTNWFKYHQAKESWYDPKWVDIKQGKYKGTAVEEFYDYYRSTMEGLVDNLPIETPYETFIPNIKADFLTRVANAGIGNALKSGFDFSSLEVLHDDPKYGKYDADNNPIDNIPILYTEALGSKEKSYDLGLLLTAFAGTSLNYKNLTELEGLKEASLAFVRNQAELITTSTGEVKTTQSGQERKKSNVEVSSHYGQLKDYVDVVFYGRRRAPEKTKVFKNSYLDRVTAWSKGQETVTEREYSWSKLFDTALQFTAIKALGFNFFAPITNYLSGEASAFITGVNGLYFNASDKTKALGLLASNDQKAKLFIDKFAVKMGDFELDELRMLSTDKIKMGLTDVAFYGYHLGDYAVQNSNFIAMLLSNKHEVRWDDYDVVEGKLVSKLPENGLTVTKFRNKVTKVNKKIMGNMDKNDLASAKRYMLGRALMQFRSWLPSMFEDRWGKKRFDYDLEEWSEGRYRVGYRYVLEHVVLPLLGNTKNRLLEWKNLTDQQKAAMRSNMLDVVLIVGAITLLGVLRGDDDDDKTMLQRYSVRVLDRTLAELTFFSIPVTYDMFADKYQILISPAAAVSTVEDISRVVKHTIGALQAEENADPARAIKRLAPGINQVQKLEDILTGKSQY